jgi:hypothetical protein
VFIKGLIGQIDVHSNSIESVLGNIKIELSGILDFGIVFAFVRKELYETRDLPF